MRRKALAALVVLLLAISSLLVLRLDPEQLSASVQSQLQQWPGHKFRTGSASLSLLHGISLRIADVNIRANVWHLHADSVRFGFSLWHLLHGETGIKSVEIIRPVLDFPKVPDIKDVAMRPFPKSLKKIRVRRGNIRISGYPVAQDFDGAIRQLNGEQELTWEVQTSLFGGDFTTQGRIRHDARGRSSVFGKLKVRHVLVSNLPKSIASMPLPRAAYDTVESSLTFDINADREWSLFGDARLHASLKKAPPIIWRGKVEGAGLQRLSWHDAFFQIGRNTMLSTVGACAHGKGCDFGMETHGAKIPLLLKVLKLNAPVSGTLDAKSAFSWKNGQWTVRGKLASHHISWSDISVPDTTVSVANARFHAPEHIKLAGIHLESVDTGGSMMLSGFITSGKQWNLDARVNNMTRAWAPFTNILLKSYGMQPELKGKGPLNADVQVSHDTGHSEIDFSIHADQAQLAYAGKFAKPEGVPASISAHADIEGNKTRLTIRRARLGAGRAEQMQWMIERGGVKSVSTKYIRMNLSRQKQDGIVFPAIMKDWHGAVTGGFTNLRPHAGTAMSDWFAHSSARLELTGFGAAEHRWNGTVHILDGALSTKNLWWQNGSRHARLSGSIHLDSLHGKMDIADAALSWEQGDALPAWFTRARLNGHLHGIDVDWMGNIWGGLHGAYRTRGTHITLRKVRARLADGSVRMPKFALVLSPESIHFSGPVRMAIVRLDKLKGLAGALGANLNGYMYLNASLEGELPWRAESAWRGNGDIEIQHGRWQANRPGPVILMDGAPAGQGEAIPFSRFAARFHLGRGVLRLTHMQWEAGPGQISGTASLHPDGTIEGELRIRKHESGQASGLSGNWPGLGGLFAKGAE